MFNANVAAIEGYANGGKNLEGASAGNLVFAYVNEVGLAALGEVRTGEVRAGTGIFERDGQPSGNEFHLDVDWAIVLPREQAISNKQARSLANYSLPVRTVFGKLWRGRSAALLEKEIRRRAGGGA